jgi:hypothetical protein
VALESSFSHYKMYLHAITRIQVQSKTLEISKSYLGECDFINFDSVGHQSNSTQCNPLVMLRKASSFLSCKIKSILNILSSPCSPGSWNHAIGLKATCLNLHH